MKKVLAFLLVGSLLMGAACQVKPKTEEAGVDSNALMSTDTTTMSGDSISTMMPDSAR